MTATELMDAIGCLGDKEITELCSYIYNSNMKHRSTRRLFRVLMASAAIIAAL